MATEEVFDTVDEAVAAHDEQEVQEVVEVPVETVPGAVVAPEDTVRPLEDVPSDDYPTDGAVPYNTNDAPELIALSNDEANNPLVTGEVERDTTLDRQEDETQAEYNERINPAVQPVQPGPSTSYLGQPL